MARSPVSTPQLCLRIVGFTSHSYIIRDLNVNSAVACPDHDEILDTERQPEDTYAMKGYAYAGGGRRVTRVDVTLDSGQTWELADIHYIEDEFRKLAQFDQIGRASCRERVCNGV